MATLTVNLSRGRDGAVSTRNSKMPGSSFATDAFACNVGSKLAERAGSVCDSCYARRLATFRRNVDTAWKRNLRLATASIAADAEEWARGMALQIRHAAQLDGENRHRWFDAGDLPSLDFLRAIVRVVELTPEVRHWLPTREAGVVVRLLKERSFPANLTVRVSSPMVDDKPLKGFSHGSTVHKQRQPGEGEVVCDARSRGNACGPCDACWNPAVASVSYPLH